MMKIKIRTHKLYAALLSAVVLILLAAAIALADGSIDTINKWAWGTNAGWINFNDANGSVTVFSDHLEGYAWGENIGWIRMGTCSGSPCTHINTTNLNYGVNNDGVGNLSGYAWGTNIGWINFNPSDSQVWVDPVTGDFEGEAWSENVGWIRFSGTAVDTTDYNVNTNWRGDLITAIYENDVAAIITNHRPGAASSAGLIITDDGFLNQSGDGIIFGHNNAAFQGEITTDLDNSSADKRWARIWQLDVNDEGGDGGNVMLTFDISDAGGNDNPATNFNPGGTYYLLGRAAGSNVSFTDVPVVSQSVSGDSITFVVNANNLGSEFTVGGAQDSPTAVSLHSVSANSGVNLPAVVIAMLFLAIMSGVILRRLGNAGNLPPVKM